MFIFGKADANSCQIDQFEVTGSTYEPRGDVTFNGTKFNCSDRSGLVELAECAALCNDSALDFNEVSDRLVSLFSFVILSNTDIINVSLFSLFINSQRKYSKKSEKQPKLH